MPKQTNFKYKIGQIVEKAKGYKFRGVVVGRYEVEGGIRYDVQVNGEHNIARLHDLMRKKLIEVPRAHTLMELENMLENCHGMIHIFSEDQLRRAE